MSLSWWLVSIGAILSIFDLLFGAITGLIVFTLGLSFIGGGVVCMITGQVELAFITIAAAMVFYMVYLHKTVQRPLLIGLQRIGLDCIVGKIGTVITSGSGHEPGTVLVDGLLWKSKGDKKLHSGVSVLVTNFDAETLTVSALTSPDQVV